MTTSIRDRIEGYTDAQLDAVIEALDSFDIEEWDEDLEEYCFRDGPQDAENLLSLVKKVRERRG